MRADTAQKILHTNQNSYDQMAKEFSDSRARFWDELAFLAEHIDRDDHVLDIGCGNGRFAPLVNARHAHYDGVDYSEGLIAEAQRKFPEYAFVTGDATALHFSHSSFDIAFSFAVIHHIPSYAFRKQFVCEAFRILHPGGKFVLTAWDIWSPTYFKKLLRSAMMTILGRNNLDVGDVVLTFGKQKRPRYVHAFTERELVRLLTECGFEVLTTDNIARKSGERNIVIVAQKPIM